MTRPTKTILAALALTLAAAAGTASAGGHKQVEPAGFYCAVGGSGKNFLDGDTTGFFASNVANEAVHMFYRNVGNNVYVGDARGNTYTIDEYGAVWTNSAGTRVRLLRC